MRSDGPQRGRPPSRRAAIAIAVTTLAGATGSPARADQRAELAAAADLPIAVSFDDLPPALNLMPYAKVDVPLDAEFDSSVPEVAVLPGGGAILIEDELSAVFLVGRGARSSSVARRGTAPHRRHTWTGHLRADRRRQRPQQRVRRRLVDGADAGSVITRQPVADPSQYPELPVGTFANAASGVVDLATPVERSSLDGPVIPSNLPDWTMAWRSRVHARPTTTTTRTRCACVTRGKPCGSPSPGSEPSIQISSPVGTSVLVPRPPCGATRRSPGSPSTVWSAH